MTPRNNFDTIKERVKAILRDYPYARQDDTFLWLMYVRIHVPELSKYIKYIPPDVLKKAPKFETITRARRFIQNEEGLYLPPENVRRRRRRREIEMRETIIEMKRGDE